MELAQTRRGEYCDMRFIGPERVAITYDMPLAEVRSSNQDCHCTPDVGLCYACPTCDQAPCKRESLPMTRTRLANSLTRPDFPV
eukprot:scaffold205847_cov31-Tisochrysis_lutea.AAC.1